MFRALDSIFRKPLMIFIMIVQLTLAFVIINFSVISYLDIKVKANNVESLFDTNNTVLLKVNPLADINKIEKVSDDNMKSIYNYIEKMKVDKKIKDYYIYYPTVPQLPPFIDYYESFYKNDGEDTFSDKATIVLNKNMFNRKPIEVKKGRTFNEEDFKIIEGEQTIPIIIGSELEQYAPIGTEFEYYDEFSNMKNSYKVIGIYKDNSMVSLMARSSFANEVLYSNRLVMLPMPIEGKRYGISMISKDYGVFIEKSNEENTYINEIINEANQYGLEYTIVNLDEDIERTMKPINEVSISMLVLGGILTTLSTIGIIATLLGYMVRREREFGARFAIGADLKSISKQIFFECLWVCILASCLAIGVNIYIGTPDEKYNMINLIMKFKLYIYYFIFIVILSGVISMPLILKIRKSNAIDLLRGK